MALVPEGRSMLARRVSAGTGRSIVSEAEARERPRPAGRGA